MYERNEVVRQFEGLISDYCRAPYAVAVESCSAALFLSCLYLKVKKVTIPKKTYYSVPFSIINAGGKVVFEDKSWTGAYQLKPYPIIDSALRFRNGMYKKGLFQCLSFQYSKHLPIGRGGMILTDSKDAADWFRKARNDGRQEIPKEKDNVKGIGWNYYMTPEQAARGISLFYWRIHGKREMADLENTHTDLTRNEVFRKVRRCDV